MPLPLQLSRVMPWSPPIFQGLWCHCGERHTQQAGYYVSVKKGKDAVLALGPFAEHDEALAQVDAVKCVVLDRYNPHGEAHWYAWGTCAIHSGLPHPPGMLNHELSPEASHGR